MKKMRRSSFFAVTILLLLVLHRSDAVETDPKGIATQTTRADPSADSGGVKLPAGDVEKEKAGEEKEKGDLKEDRKEIATEERDKPLVEPKPKPEEEEETRGKDGSNGSSGAKEVRTMDGGVEECDPANRCIDEKSEFVACLRVPGKDSLDLSLLIQNKGKGSLDIHIIAPDLVDLEQNKVQVKAKDNKEVEVRTRKITRELMTEVGLLWELRLGHDSGAQLEEVKVSVRDGGKNTMIVLKAGDGDCKLDFGNMISNSFKRSENPASTRFLSRFSTRTSLVIIFAAVVMLLGFAWVCIRFWWMKRRGGPMYQKVEVGLPVSTGEKKVADVGDGWDSGWGDEWDDEEAPVTPSKPVLTPSSNGLASRKSNKDGWKD